MAEAIATIQTVKWMTDTLWEFSLLIKRYNGLPGRVLDLEENLHACEVTLKRWKEKWGVEERQPNVYYEVLWSKRGWRAIRICLGAIDDICQIVKAKVHALLGTALKYQSKGRRRSYEGSFDLVTMRRAMARIDRHMSRRHRFSWAVMLKADDLDAQLARFNTKLTNLEIFSQSYLKETHPTLYDQTPTPERLHQETQALIEDRMREKYHTMVSGSREDAESLHKAYAGDHGLNCHLAISPTNSKKDSRLTKDFHFLVTAGQKTTEVIAHPVQFNRSDNIARLPNTISDAFNSLSTNSRGRPGDLLPPGATEGNGFELRLCPKPRLTPLASSLPLSDLLTAARVDAYRALSTKDKTHIAVGLIEGCYRLLGASWLNYLDSAKVRGAKGADGKWDAMLSCQAGSSSINKALATFASQPANRTRDLRKHAQIFRLGLVLAELAVGSSVAYVEASEDMRTPGVSVVMPEVGDDERLDADEIAAAVEQNAGETYADFVRFCLSMLQQRSRIKQTDVDEGYEAMLFHPAKQMSGLIS